VSVRLASNRLAVMLNHRFGLMVVFAAYVLSGANSQAADIRVDPSRKQGAVLEGRIESGDFDKLKNFLLDGPGATEIYLASPGGNLAEAIRIGRLLRLLKLSTVVPNKSLTNEARESAGKKHGLKNTKTDYTCASACFFIFIAGIHRRDDSSGLVSLGIHRPSMSRADLRKLGREKADAIDDRVRRAVDRYLDEMRVPPKYADEMFSIPPNGMRWIQNEDFERDFSGYIPELKIEVDKICGDPTSAAPPRGTNDNAHGDQSIAKRELTTPEENRECEQRLRDDLAIRMRDSARQFRDSMSH
jgi:hypothetical protein